MNTENDPQKTPDRTGFAIAGLVLSFISVVLIILIMTIPFLILLIRPLFIAFCGLVGLILSIVGLKSQRRRGAAIAGIVLSTLIMCGMVFVQVVFLSVTVAD